MKIHVAYTVDIQGQGAVQFADQLFAGIYALRQTKRNEDELFVHVLCANIAGDTVIKCQRLARDDFHVEFKVIPKKDLDYMQKFTKNKPNAPIRTWNGIVFARIWLARALPAVDRVIYLDTDTLVRKSLDGLYSEDLGGKTLGMVMSPTWEYGYNSGVILMDLKKMRSDDQMWLDLDEFMEKNALKFFFPDQTVINQFWKDEIKELPEKYNHLPKPEIRPFEGTDEAVIWHFFAGAPKQHRMSELEHCNAIWNTLIMEAEGKAV